MASNDTISKQWEEVPVGPLIRNLQRTLEHMEENKPDLKRFAKLILRVGHFSTICEDIESIIKRDHIPAEDYPSVFFTALSCDEKGNCEWYRLPFQGDLSTNINSDKNYIIDLLHHIITRFEDLDAKFTSTMKMIIETTGKSGYYGNMVERKKFSQMKEHLKSVLYLAVALSHDDQPKTSPTKEASDDHLVKAVRIKVSDANFTETPVLISNADWSKIPFAKI